MADYVIAIDQGTTSSRAIVFDKAGSIISSGQLEHEQIFPKAGWVEHDPTEIWNNTREVIGQALSKASLTRHDIAAIGITNQRETAVVWDKTTGKPVYNAIVWQDTRTQSIVDRLAKDGGVERFKPTVGLPLATYFSGTKIVWILENVEGAREKAEAGDLLFGTTDSWVLWNLTGGTDGGVHVTDVTNASRTLFMDLETLQWDDEILGIFDVPKSMLPEIKSSSEVYGHAHSSTACSGRPRSPASSATSRLPRSARPLSTPASRRTPTAPETSSSSTPVRKSSTPRTACSRRSATSSATRSRTTRSRVRSP